MVQISSYIWDITDFINRLQRLPKLPPGCLLVTFDVSSLYTNIRHKEGIILIYESHRYLPKLTSAILSDWLYQWIHSVLTTLTIYKSMTLPWALVWHDHMPICDREAGAWVFADPGQNTLSVVEVYIDDIFAIWIHGKPFLCAFINSLNRHNSTIKFTATWFAEQVIFLDTRVYLRDGLTGTDLHVKPTDKHQYLQMDSCHPKHYKTVIPYNQALHHRWICLKEENVPKWTHELKEHFLKRG